MNGPNDQPPPHDASATDHAEANGESVAAVADPASGGETPEGGNSKSTQFPAKSEAKAKRRDKKDKPEYHGLFPKLWHEWVKPLGTVILIVTVVRSSLVDWNDVPSGSMRPTILEGDRIVVNKLAYGFNLPFNGPVVDLPLLPAFNNPLDFLPGFYWSAPERGDIVTFWNPTPDFKPQPTADDPGRTVPNESSGIRMVKRVIGLPGESVRVVDGRLEIRDAQGNPVGVRYTPLVEGPYADEPTMATRRGADGRLRGQQARLPVDFALEFFGPGDDVLPHYVQWMRPHLGWQPGGLRYRDVPKQTTDDPVTWITLRDADDPKDDEYLMIGDNRDNSLDSRYYWEAYGQLPGGKPVLVRGEHITGKAKFIAVSFRDGSFLSPAWERFFRSFDGEARSLTE